MDDLLERALDLWQAPVPEGDAGVARFRTVYTDPVAVNGSLTDLVVLVERARMLQRCFDTVGREVDASFAADGRCAFSFRLYGRQVGPLATPLGELAPTGRRLEAHGMDIFEIVDGRVCSIWAVLDWLDLLTQAGAVAMTEGA